MMRKIVVLLAVACIVYPSHIQSAEISQKETAYQKVAANLTQKIPYKQVLSPEGEFIAVFNDEVERWVKEKFDKATIGKIRASLEPHLKIELTARGFAPAATRALEAEKDETNYDAIWVRDNVWVWYSLLKDPARKEDAKKLILALWDYYATEKQVARFAAVIANPTLSQDAMAMPHIRFNGASPALDDVMVQDKPEEWNHRQIDAHGLFFTALGEAFAIGLLSPDDITPARFKALALYPLFLNRIKFETYEDAGAWEEIPRRNTSSIALATRSLQVWRKLVYQEKSGAFEKFHDKFKEMIGKEAEDVAGAWKESSLKDLIKSGLGTVKRQLAMGGESPDYKPEDLHFRLADAALIVLIQPSPLEDLSEAEMRRALLIVETLKRPMGVLRYLHDSYQAGNYWIEKPAAADKDKPALTGDTSSQDAFLWRLSKLIPDTEAQWFFDSLLAMARLHLAEITSDPKLREQDIFFATVHIKRALGQITGAGITADGKAVKPWQSPESVNTVVIDNQKYFLPSPITPLNWAKAALGMALREYERIAVK